MTNPALSRRVQEGRRDNPQRIFKLAASITAIQFASSAMALLQHRLMAHTFGAGAAIDAYTVTWLLTSVVYQILVSGPLIALLVPVFRQTSREKGDQTCKDLAAGLQGYLLITLSCLAVVIWLFAPWLARAAAPGFTGYRLELTANLLRTMGLAIPLLGLCGLYAARLYALDRFYAPPLGQLAVNMSLAFFTWAFASSLGPLALGYGTVFGGALALLIHLLAIGRKGALIRLGHRLPAGYLSQLFRILTPIGFIVLLGVLPGFIDRYFGSFLAPGSLSTLLYAYRVVQVCLAFGLAMASISLPRFADLAQTEDASALGEALAQTIRLLVFVLLPVTILLALLGDPLVTLLYGGGAFNQAAATSTALSLGIFGTALLPVSISWMLMRAWYATQRPAGALVLSVAWVVLTLALDPIMIGRFGYVGLAISYAASTSGALVIVMLTPRRPEWLRALRLHLSTTDLARMFIAAMIALVPTAAIVPVVRTPQRVSVAVLAAVAFAGIYLAASWRLQVPEARLLWRLRERAKSRGFSSVEPRKVVR